MDLSRNRIIFVTSTSCVFLLEQSSYLFCCTPLLPLTLGGAPPLHPLCTPYHRCCTPRLWRCTPLAPPRTLTGVGLWNITDVLEFPSTLMEQRTLDARGVLYRKVLKASAQLPEKGFGWVRQGVKNIQFRTQRLLLVRCQLGSSAAVL